MGAIYRIYFLVTALTVNLWQSMCHV
uniref:Uncharacterized protein n=1 Tax=Anguilla anguilla TaxID=7936 RepID=A0A0E9S911_ANGAN